jgi:hypothetical protein
MSNLSLRHHPTTRWPHHSAPTMNFEHFWRQIPPYGSRSNELPALPSPATVTHLPERLDRTFPVFYTSKCSRPSTICRSQAPKKPRNLLHSVLCGPAYRKIAASGHGLAKPASAVYQNYSFCIPLPPVD